jgi:HEPN domain-containing protein
MSDQPRQFPDEFYARLLFYAQADLHAAERVLQDSEGYWHLPCFAAREGAEKALKGFIEAAGKRAPAAHGLRTLLQECIAIDKGFGRFRPHCDLLAPYQAEARYPEEDQEYDFTAEEAADAVRLARELFDFVQAKIEQRKQAGLL